jgi:hypothetical protein
MVVAPWQADRVCHDAARGAYCEKAVGMVSQQGIVDWFAFWLKGEEDSDPAKAEQYARSETPQTA